MKGRNIRDLTSILQSIFYIRYFKVNYLQQQQKDQQMLF